jgi:hypothetical protein
MTSATTARIYDTPPGFQTPPQGQTMYAPPAPPVGIAVAAGLPPQFDLSQVDELTLAKLRLVALRTPPGQGNALEAVRRRPWPFLAGAAAAGLLIGRSGLIRNLAGKGIKVALSRAVMGGLQRLRR